MAPTSQQLQAITGNPVKVIRLDPNEFAEFKALYVDKRHGVENQKLLEYFISYKFLEFGPSDTYIDIAAQDCPFAFFVHEKVGCKTYRQDLYYMKKGIHGSDIGGDASNLPLKDETVTKISLHNSFEHFEGESDIGFIKESQRVLAMGGKMIINPVFFEDVYRVETNAGWVDEAGEHHLWGKGARFGRFYDVEQFMERVIKNAPLFNIQFYFIENILELGPGGYGHSFVVFEKTKPYDSKIFTSLLGR